MPIVIDSIKAHKKRLFLILRRGYVDSRYKTSITSCYCQFHIFDSDVSNMSVIMAAGYLH